MRHRGKTTQVDGRAVVVGGSMAGLLAATVCARHFSTVTLVERDRMDGSATPRRGVPQGRMLHALLPGGMRILDEMFPGYSADLRAAGAVPVNVPRDALALVPPGWVDRRAPGWVMVSASRPLLESVLRRRVLADGRIGVLDRHEVTGLRAERGTVRAAVVRSLEDAASEDLEADLVVDAAGRGSRAPAWLTAMGVPVPPETVVDPDIAYSCQTFRMPSGFAADWQVIMLFSRPPSMPRTGYLFPIEGDQWLVGLMGAAGQHPPTDDAGFHAFARSLRHPVLAQAIATAEPVAPARAYKGTVNRLRHFERIPVPDGLIAVGDAVCAFNPVYGQGISTAALAARTLDECLMHRRSPDLAGVSRRFQRRLARRNADPWLLSTGEDLRFPTTTGVEVTGATRMLHRYLDRVVAATTLGPGAAQAYVQVLGMLSRPASLFSPKVAAAAARARRTDPSAPPPAAPDRTPATASA